MPKAKVHLNKSVLFHRSERCDEREHCDAHKANSYATLNSLSSRKDPPLRYIPFYPGIILMGCSRVFTSTFRLAIGSCLFAGKTRCDYSSLYSRISAG